MKQVYTTIPVLLKKLAAVALLLTCLTPLNGQAQSITLLSPNGGEAWLAETYEEVSWSGDSLSSMLRLEFSPDGGSNWWYFGEISSAPNGGITAVFVPDFISNNAILRIIDFSNPAVNDVSDAPFTVSFQPIAVWQPDAGSAVFVNTLTYVSWAAYQPGLSLINAEISTDNGLTFSPVAQNINAQSGYTYLDLSDVAAEECILKLYNAEDPATFSLSQVFTISNIPVYNLTSPSGGEIANVYSPVTISWTVESPYSDNCDLEYSTDNGETWLFINNAINTGNSGSYVWTTPNVNSEECMVRIRDMYAQTSTDLSEAFTIMPFPETPVCMVTVDSLTNYNVIVWEKPDSDLIADFLVYKETDQTNVYEVIDTVGYNEEPIVTDFGSNPEVRPYRYKLGFRDSEDRVFPASGYHQTIHLTINQGVSSNWNLIWTPYTGFDYNSYKIMRKSGDGAFEQIATVSSSFSSYTDFDAPAGDIAYMVKIDNPDGCNTGLRNAVYTDVYSNQASASMVSAGDISKTIFSVYPVPANDLINIQFGDNAKGTIKVTITDVTGRIIYSEDYSDIREGHLKTVNSSDFNEGLYLLNVISSDNRMAKKIVVRH